MHIYMCKLIRVCTYIYIYVYLQIFSHIHIYLYIAYMRLFYMYVYLYMHFFNSAMQFMSNYASAAAFHQLLEKQNGERESE